MIELNGVVKTFVLHNQGGAVIEVMRDAGFSVAPGECVALSGASGAGKSTLMRMIYGNYLASAGQIRVAGVDLVQAEPREILALRRESLGYVSQFLRVVPRVPTLQVVAEPLLTLGVDAETAQARAADLLRRLRIPEPLWSLSPTTFSGGEQQRVNIARGFAHDYPALLLDEPTASLDAKNRRTVLDLILDAKARGAAIVGIFHDAAARAEVCDREIDVSEFAPRGAA
ncbi:MAG: phosphonate C-P lyase system protein PhnL [Marinibacterium sp.]|nr:phosphonate C-P lyase system protein PhnL [Marinibacterium sp.]